MAAARVKKLKAVAEQMPQTREEVSENIHRLGDIQREALRLETRMNDKIAAITEAEMPRITELKKEIASLFKGIQAWCDTNKASLTKDGKVKTVNLITGAVSWRTRPPSCTVRKPDVVLEALHNLGLTRFIRTKEEVNKEAILADPKAVTGIAGITVQTGIEDFSVMPFEQDAGVK
ncbi:host-nuclease inhibitor protein Gam [Salmonella enterica]|nr:host-nuclease inhibitor protein Gam [Salmonella enterica]ECC2870016.1 host-nuclease inhibitor protein Gam [Salmonella enterica subsp. enterica serovar Tanger]EBH4416661.1 host-nuclease inhibitor protein Gam [Salmonella enterica]ECH0315300.1 host-nuclease inhibitor protein Gam [Salmonella enterica]ECP5831986.1 host-nuclease inhibitor protein Gam [Salmonella enterica]